MIYKVVFDPRAIIDIQETVTYYDSKKEGLGLRFYETLEEHIAIISKTPFFQLRYKDYHALPIKKFPFIILYYIDENLKIVYIMSVFNTFLNPIKYPK
ncbi:type II toxin-antitoxin system RelE/ParE family toxin [Flavobacterium sp. SUN052]|uniref:type II toxin-antitoxin system RelE/ParE family toxin n=1 Tax=Flavobacterium sp. SUN052 TaxID=3002441 RepID=UPI00237E637B|nr:type II toxin-antitoxin system RelE/ParE family toxin [Flavobacterium sp. SUN052]MEC4005706.1 type II toxin-antitoxin system RelE/ParE family toxin [Flavobacterium sp. SUN052]